MVTIALIFTSIILVALPNLTDCGITSQWEECGCRWDDWEAWGTCSSECNGYRRRSRKVWSYTNKAGCVFAFSTCATNDMGWDESRCNAFCYNGGTSNSYSCSCVTGFYGSCCGFQINCGYPGSINNGDIHGTTYTYGATVSYICHGDYLLVDGSSSRTCQLSALWSGSKPRCAYFNSCASNPCKNEGTCTNIPDDYECACSSGWSGKSCENDIQPPVMNNCSSDQSFTTDSLTTRYDWKVPEFSDPHNFDVVVTSNYPSNVFTFPWGDFSVSYSAVKPSNGLDSECLFEIKVRPNPCPVLNIPANGALVCNNWKTDYGQICILFCKNSYTVPRGVDADDFYICGASGSWSPKNTMPDCSVQVLQQQTMSGYSIANTYNNCTESYGEMQKYYIDNLRQSEFSYFCEKYEDECTEQNVLIKC